MTACARASWWQGRGENYRLISTRSSSCSQSQEWQVPGVGGRAGHAGDGDGRAQEGLQCGRREGADPVSP